MQKTVPMRRAGLVMLLALTVSGCAQTLGFGSTEAVKSRVQVRVIDNSLKNFETFDPSPRDTCRSQRAMVEHNSVYDTLKMRKAGKLKKGEVIAYCAPCDCPDKYRKKPAPAAKAEPGATS